MIKSKFVILTLGLTAAISPLAIIAACSNNPTAEISRKEEPTVLKQKQFLATDLKLDQPIAISQQLINQQWIVDHINLLFNGTTKHLNSFKQILELNVIKINDQLNIDFKLAANSYVDQTYHIANDISSTFSFKITNFVSDQIPDLPEQIDLSKIVEQATFDVNNKNQILPSQVKPEQLVWEQSNANTNVDLEVIDLIPDDQNGKLGYQVKFSQKDLTTNLENLVVKPNDAKAINGFKVQASTPSDQSKLDQEIARLEKEQTTIINVTKLSTIDIINYQSQPATFKTNLINLKENEFSYHVFKFNVDSQKTLTIDLFVQYKSATKFVQLSKQIEVLEINIDDPNWLRKAELDRLNKLITNSVLLKTTFSTQEKEQLEKNPNQVLKHLFNFVSTFGFHYQIFDLKFSPIQANKTSKLTFKIAAKLWRTPEGQKPIITSNQFSYDVEVIEEAADSLPPVPTPNGWQISPSDQVITDPTDPEIKLLTIDLKADPQLDFAKYENADAQTIDSLMMKIFNKAQDQFIKITGDLPNDWDWNKYLTLSFDNAIRNQKNQLIGYKYLFQFEYVNSQNLEDWFLINVDITNGYNSGNQPAKPTAEQIWNDLKTKFTNLIKNQAIDDDKLHFDLGGNGIYGFAQINADNPSRADHFSNFLNFSPTQFMVDNQHLVKAKIEDASINYLTNTIKFKWVLEGLNNNSIGIDLSQYHEEFNNQVIQYQPKNKWADVIRFDDKDPQLAITKGISLNNILDRFGLSNQFVSENLLKERFAGFGQSWTWKARELANYLRFTFYQAFNDGADVINMAILGADVNNLAWNANPQDYTIVLKARLNAKARGTYLPYLQMFGANVPIQARSWKTDDIIEIRLQASSIPAQPDVVKNANEILPGLGPGNVLGTGQGATQAYLNSPPRNDLYSIALGSNALTINVNNQPYLTNHKANHRFIAFNMLSRYDFKDLINPEPTPEQGWIS